MPLQQITPTDITGTLTNNVASSQLSIGGTAIGAGDASIMKNRIINGAMVIDQRTAGASASTTVTGSGTYASIDRYAYIVSQASKFTMQQNAGSVTPPVGFTNYLGITSTSAYSISSSDYFGIYQPIEGYNIADLNWGSANAKTVTLSFWVQSSLTGTFGGALKNQAGNRSYPFSYTISSANTWTQISITIVGDTTGTWVTNNGIGMYVQFSLGVGSTYSNTAGAWAAGNYTSATGATSVVGTNGATWYVTGVQLEVGSSATGFEYRQYGQELQLCYRYYETFGHAGSGRVSGGNTTAFGYSSLWTVTKRTTPTVTLLSGFTNQVVSPTIATYTVTAIASNNGTTQGVYLNMTSSGLTSSTNITGFTDAWMSASAEL